MDIQSKLIEDLEGALSNRSAARDARLVRNISDLLFRDGAAYSDEQIDLFDDLLNRLINDTETDVRAELARRLCASSSSPPKVLRRLALDDSAEVAAQLLSRCEHLDDSVLIECADMRSQEHLLAVCRRHVLSELVTDRLVDRGQGPVLLAVVENVGARFSNSGFGILVMHSASSDVLAIRVGTRTDLPRHHFLKLLTVAPETAHKALEEASAAGLTIARFPRLSPASQTPANDPAAPRDYRSALIRVRDLRRRNSLGERELFEYISNGKYDEAVVAIALLADISVEIVDQAMMQARHEQLLTIIKATGLGWPTAKALLRLRAGDAGLTTREIEQCLSSYIRLSVETARRALLLQRDFN